MRHYYYYNYHEKFMSVKSNLSKTLKLAKQVLIERKKTDPRHAFRIYNMLVNDLDEIANAFNNYFFTNIGPNLAKNLSSQIWIRPHFKNKCSMFYALQMNVKLKLS